MPARTSSALSAHRRAVVVDKIVQKCVLGLENAGYGSISESDIEALENELADLFNPPRTSSALSHSSFANRSHSPQLPIARPASASAVATSSGSCTYLPAAGAGAAAPHQQPECVSQSAVDAVLERFTRGVKATQVQSAVASIAADAAGGGGGPPPLAGGRPPLHAPSPMPVQRMSPLGSASSPASPVSLVRMLRTTPSPNALHTLHSFEHMMAQMGEVPGSKRMRKMVRDTEEYRAIQSSLAAQQQKDEEKKKCLKLAAVRLRVDLDVQVREKQRKRAEELDAQIRLRRALDQDQQLALRQEEQLQRQRRDQLEVQKLENFHLSQTLRDRETNARGAELQRSVSELSVVRDQLRGDEHAKLLKKIEQTAQLSKTMEMMRSREEQQKLERQQSLRDAIVYQNEADAYYKHLEEGRSAARDRVQQSVGVREALSTQQHQCVLRSPSADEQKEIWLRKKLESDSLELRRKADLRQQTQEQRKKAANDNIQATLALQMSRKKLLAAQEVEESKKYAAGVQYSLAMQELVDDVKKEKSLQEREEWLRLIDVQQKYRKFNEMKDIETNLARSPSY